MNILFYQLTLQIEMAYFKSKSMNVSLILFCILISMITANDDAYTDCMQMMKDYCNVNKPDTKKQEDPTSLDCIQVAIEHWQWHTTLPQYGAIPPGIMREYYLSFDLMLELDEIPLPKELCDEKKHIPALFHRCKSELQEFGADKREAITHALYATRNVNFDIEPQKKEGTVKCYTVKSLQDMKKKFLSSSSKNDDTSTHFGLIYMIRLQNYIGVLDEKVKQPWKYCEDYSRQVSDIRPSSARARHLRTFDN